LFAELDDFDYLMFEDDDGDGVLNGSDDCLDTPPGVEVDSMGCPLDEDRDGVPDYYDLEDSRPGAIVDSVGVEYEEDELIRLMATPEAIPRRDLPLYVSPGREIARMTLKDLPEKFHVLDTDGDQYISFDELLLAIDDFFDYRSFMNTDEVYSVINFFFAQ
jgi:Ca2+-binding EF-hand superfamily protein